MENAIPSLLIGAILLVASSLMARGSLHSYDQLGTSLRQMETRLGEQAQTRLTITDTDLDWANNTLTVDVRNDGQTRIASFEKLDVILTYYTSSSAQLTVWLPYTTGVPGANSWTVDDINNDSYEPGILNPGETLELRIELSPAVYDNRTNLVVISSETGSSVSAAFSS